MIKCKCAFGFCLLMIACMLGGCSKNSNDAEGHEMTETIISQITDFEKVFGIYKWESDYSILGISKNSNCLFTIYTSDDDGKSFKQMDTKWAKEVSGISNNNIYVFAGDMKKDGSVLLGYEKSNEDDNSQCGKIQYYDANRECRNINLNTGNRIVSVRFSQKDKGFFVNYGSAIVCYDFEGKEKQKFQQEDIIDFLEVKDKLYVLTAKYIYTYNINTGKLESKDSGISSIEKQLKNTSQNILGNYNISLHVLKYASDGSLYLMLKDGIYKYRMGGVFLERKVDCNHNSFSDYTYFPGDYVINEDEDYIVMMQGEDTRILHYTNEKSSLEPSVDTTAKNEYTTQQGKTDKENQMNYFDGYVSDSKYEVDEELKGDITVYSLRPGSCVEAMVDVYERYHPNVEVKVEIGMEEDSNITVSQAINTLNTELLSGIGPDIIIMDGLDEKNYENNELLLDLSEVYAELKAENELLENITSCYKRDDGIYAIPTLVDPTIMIGDTKELNNVNSVNDLYQFVQENVPRDGNALNMYTWKQLYNVLYPCYSTSILNEDKKYEDKKMEEFITGLKNIWVELKAQTEKNDAQDAYEKLKRENTELGLETDFLDHNFDLNVMNLAFPEEIGQKLAISRIYMQYQFGEIPELVSHGYTYSSLSISEGESVYVPVRVVSVAKTSNNIEIAKDFVKKMFQTEEQTISGTLMYGVPVTTDALKIMSQNGMLIGRNYKTKESVGCGYFTSKQQFDDFYKFLLELKTAANMDEAFQEIVEENLDAYMNEKISWEEYKEHLEEKLQVFLNE